MDTMVTDKFSFPGALQWKGVSDLVTAVFGGDGGGALLTRSIVWSMGIAAFAALVMEVLRIRTKNRFPLSPLAIGLGVVVPPDSSLMMFLGAAFFWYMGRRYGSAARVEGLRHLGGLAGADLRGTHRGCGARGHRRHPRQGVRVRLR